MASTELRLAVEESRQVETVRANEEKKWGKHCIYKLPAYVTDKNENAYMPRAISLGPYHNGNPKLRPMESHKSRVLVRFLERAGKSMEDCIGALEGVAEQLMDAYDSLDPKWRNAPEAFLEVMIRDGCFMLEIMGYFAKDVYPLPRNFESQYGDKDPIFSYHGVLNVFPYIRHDMLMLENQLPLFLLNRLLSFEGPRKTQTDEYGIKLIVEFCRPRAFTGSVLSYVRECEHVLDVYLKLLIRGTPNTEERSWWSKLQLWATKKYEYISSRSGKFDRRILYMERPDITPSVTRLDGYRISIQRSRTTSIRDIDFYTGPLSGVLELPPIVVDDTAQAHFLNLMAFERFHVGAGNDVTSYIAFMSDLINDDMDVKILQKRGILSNALGSNMAVVHLFNSLSKDITLDSRRNRLVAVRILAKKRCRRKWIKHWGDLIHTYLTSPWSGITLIAAILVFGLGIVNTVFSILDYYNN